MVVVFVKQEIHQTPMTKPKPVAQERPSIINQSPEVVAAESLAKERGVALWLQVTREK